LFFVFLLFYFIDLFFVLLVSLFFAYNRSPRTYFFSRDAFLAVWKVEQQAKGTAAAEIQKALADATLLAIYCAQQIQGLLDKSEYAERNK
jgi:hypothetical protein